MSVPKYENVVKSKHFVDSVLSQTNSEINKRNDLNNDENFPKDLDKSFLNYINNENVNNVNNNIDENRKSNENENTNGFINIENENMQHIDINKKVLKEKEINIGENDDRNDISSIDFGSAQSIIIDNKHQRIKIVSLFYKKENDIFEIEKKILALKEKRLSLNKGPVQFDRFVGQKEINIKKSQNLEPIYLNSLQSLDKKEVSNSKKNVKPTTNLKKFELKSLRMSIDIVSN